MKELTLLQGNATPQATPDARTNATQPVLLRAGGGRHTAHQSRPGPGRAGWGANNYNTTRHFAARFDRTRGYTPVVEK